MGVLHLHLCVYCMYGEEGGGGRWFVNCVSGNVEMYRVCMYVRMHWCFVYRASYGSAEQSNARISDLNEKVDNVSSTNNCVDIV